MDDKIKKQGTLQPISPGNNAEPSPDETDRYSRLSTVELAELVVENSDAAALKELAEKRKLIFYKDKWISLLEFIDRLTKFKFRFKYAFGTEIEIEDITSQAKGILYARFTNLFGDGGPDCRNQYRAFLYQIRGFGEDSNSYYRLERERFAGKKLRSLVFKHFKHCLLEANREANEFFSRYTWRAEKLEIELKRPVWISTKEFRTWLEENTKDFRLESREARTRIQDKIYQAFGRGGFHPLEDAALEADEPEKPVSTVNVLARLVADKKVAEFKSLRPTIRFLGKKKVKKLVVKILDGLTQGGYKDADITEEFGLLKPTLSRFAGSRWGKGKDSSVPDLWRNVAEVAAGDARFTEAIVGQGLKGIIERILGLDTTVREEKENG